MAINQEYATDGFHSHDGSHCRTESEERPESPDQIYLTESMLEEANIERQDISHGEFERYVINLDNDYDVTVSESGNGSALRIFAEDSTYGERFDYFPDDELEVRELLLEKEVSEI